MPSADGPPFVNPSWRGKYQAAGAGRGTALQDVDRPRRRRHQEASTRRTFPCPPRSTLAFRACPATRPHAALFDLEWRGLLVLSGASSSGSSGTPIKGSKGRVQEIRDSLTNNT